MRSSFFACLLLVGCAADEGARTADMDPVDEPRDANARDANARDARIGDAGRDARAPDAMGNGPADADVVPPADASATDAQRGDTGTASADCAAFVGYSRGGGEVEPGAQLLSENGFALLYVEESCRFWARRTRWDPIATGTLDAATQAQLKVLLRLDEFASYAGQYHSSVCDAPTFTYAHGSEKVSVQALCNTGIDDSAKVAWLLDAFKEALDLTVAAGEPWDGAVRFVLVDGSGMGLDYGTAPRWPLASSHVAQAHPFAEAGSLPAGSSVRAEGADAAALRKLWDKWREGFDAGTVSTPFIPVRGPGGESLQLYVRDSMPLEAADGLLALP